MKAVTHLADLKTKHRDKKSWSEVVIADSNSRGVIIQEASGFKTGPRLYADSPAWWAVLEGQIHFEIQKADGAEFWVVMLGELRWIFEGDFDDPVIAGEGEVPGVKTRKIAFPDVPGPGAGGMMAWLRPDAPKIVDAAIQLMKA